MSLDLAIRLCPSIISIIGFVWLGIKSYANAQAMHKLQTNEMVHLAADVKSLLDDNKQVKIILDAKAGTDALKELKLAVEARAKSEDIKELRVDLNKNTEIIANLKGFLIAKFSTNL
jgi:hypothetical protein